MHITTIFSYLVARLAVQGLIAFLIVFAIVFAIINYHIESYRRFQLVRAASDTLTNDDLQRQLFLLACMEHNPLRSKKIHKEEQKRDTFRWINKIIATLWPYLSSVIHQELNEFFREQLRTGSLSRSTSGSKRLFYAILHQLDTNISSIEHCQLGDQWPIINDLRIMESSTQTLIEGHKVKSKAALVRKKGKVLVCDIDLHYNGDMNLSVIYKYFCCCSSRFGLKDIFLHFKPRFVFGPISRRSPFIEEMALTLLQQPKFGYKGIALVELAELRLIRRMIYRLISEHVLQPRVIVIELGRVIERALNGPPRARLDRSSGGPRRDIIELKATESVQESESTEPPLLTRLTARLLLCSCLCSNLFLRCIQNSEPSSYRDRMSKSLSPDGHKFSSSTRPVELSQMREESRE